MKLQRILFTVRDALKFFQKRTFTIENYNFVDLQRELIGADKEIFFIKEKHISAVDYLRDGYNVSVRVLLKETLEDTEIARKRYPYLKFSAAAIKIFVFYIVFKFLTRFIQNFQF